jgi:PAS domain S-box-containing protein
VKTKNEFAERLRTARYDVILADYNLESWIGMDVLELVHAEGQDIPVIVVTGHLGDEAAVECVKNGAADYILKDRMERLPVAIHRAVEERSLRNERQRAEQLLKESETRFRVMTEALTVAVFIEQDAQCSYANRAASRITGYSPQELMGTSFYQLIVSGSRQQMTKRFTESLDLGSTSCCGEAQILTKKSEERWLDVTVVKLSLKGTSAALITALDITDRKHREDEIRRLVK